MAVKCIVKAHKASSLKICMRWVIKLLYSLRTPADTITAKTQQKAFIAPPVSLSSFALQFLLSLSIRNYNFFSLHPQGRENHSKVLER